MRLWVFFLFFFLPRRAALPCRHFVLHLRSYPHVFPTCGPPGAGEAGTGGAPTPPALTRRPLAHSRGSPGRPRRSAGQRARHPELGLGRRSAERGPERHTHTHRPDTASAARRLHSRWGGAAAARPAALRGGERPSLLLLQSEGRRAPLPSPPGPPLLRPESSFLFPFPTAPP